MKINIYELLFNLGRQAGCHQMPERSFFYKGKQFPVCARCTGAFIGNIVGGAVYFFLKMPIWLCLLLCFILFVDWYIQYLNICQSTNIRRLITGILCGAGLTQIYFSIIESILNLLL